MHLQFLDNENDIALLRRFQQGDESAFTLLFHQHSSALYRKILWMVNDDEIANDLLQELFLKLWETRERIDLSKPFKAYLYTIASNLVYDFFRKSANRKKYEKHLLSLADEHYSHIEEALFSKDNQTLINEAIDQLPPQRKQIFTLCRLEGKSYDEVSDMLKISKSTIQDHIVKANRAIKDYLSNHPDLLIFLLVAILFRP
ncbi:MAG: RNA polymerase sigma factor [Bacteroidales bacterium]